MDELDSIDIDKSLDYWRLNAPKYPRLAKLAKHYLSIPASSASVERLFSTAGYIAWQDGPDCVCQP